MGRVNNAPQKAAPPIVIDSARHFKRGPSLNPQSLRMPPAHEASRDREERLKNGGRDFISRCAKRDAKRHAARRRRATNA